MKGNVTLNVIIKNTLPIFSIIFIAIMIIGGWSLLAPIAIVLSAAFSILILINYLAKKKFNIRFWFSYLVLIAGVFLFYLIWGAESFWKRIGYNLILTIIPAGLAILLYFWDSSSKSTYKKVISIILTVLMIGSSTFYFIAMRMRVRPKVFSLAEGQEDYLSSIKNSASSSSPNVLFILMDDMAYSDLSCYSYLGRSDATIHTPNLDALADEGVMFENFYSCSPVCSPSRFGILTGRYSARGYMDQVVFPSVVSLNPFGSTRYYNPFIFKNNVDGILGDEITIAEAMQSAGYSTALFGKWNLGDYGEYLPTNQGFDYFYGSYYVNDMTPYNWVREIDQKAVEVKSHKEMTDQSETTKFLTEEVNNYIDRSVEKGEKFFAYYATPWPHYPIFSGEKGVTSDDNYIACIEEFDRYLADIINNLKEKGVYDDTLIVFTSDNGPGREGVTGALRGRKGTTFEGGQKVPLIVSYPNGNVGDGDKVITTPAMNIDFFPTLLQYAGVASLPGDRVIDGVSMYGVLEGTASSDANIHDTLYYLRTGKVQAVQMPVDVDGITYNFKYYKSVNSENTAFFDQVYRNYLFNLSTDPAEGYNTSMIHPEVADKLAKQLEAFRKELKNNRRGVIKEYYK